MTQIIAVANEKGGVAKTTTIVSLGGAFIEYNFNVLMVDLDAQANLTLAMGIQPGKIRRSTADILLNSTNALSVSRETGFPGLDVIPANAEMGLAERFLPVRSNHTTILRNLLKNLDVYDFILIDCPPSLGAVTHNALAAADLLIIPTQAEYFSAFALRNMINLVRRVQLQENPSLDFRILLTMFDQRNRIHRIIRDQVHARFRDKLLNTIIQIDTKIRESSVAGIPITHFSKSSRAALQYRELAQELADNVQEKSAQSAI